MCCNKTLEPNSLHQKVKNETGSLIVKNKNDQKKKKGGNVKPRPNEIIKINWAEAYLADFQERLLSYSSNQQYFKAIK